MSHESWKQVSSEIILSHPRLTVAEDSVLLPDGTQTQYLRFENQSDYVSVLAVRDEKIAVIKDYSYPHDEWLWQFPEGSIEKGETPQAAAARELQEEAGLAADTWYQLGMNYGHHRRSIEKNLIFLAMDVHEVEKTAGDIEEQGIELHWLTIPEIKSMIANGAILQKNALAALALYLVHTATNQLT